MPVVRVQDFGTARAPDWCRIADGICGMGVWACGPDGQVEPHFHDNEEFWFITRGRAKVVTEGCEHIVEKGDVVCTHMGDEHAILSVPEHPYEHIWIACNRRGKNRGGHLHRGVDDPAERDGGDHPPRPSLHA